MKENKWQTIPIAIVILLLISEIIWYSPQTHPKEAALTIQEVTFDETGNITINLTLTTNLPLNATIIITPVTEKPEDLPVYIFYDKNYPTVGTSWTLIQMLWEHVKTELSLRGYSSEVKLTDAENLENILKTKTPAIIIMASGAFPSNIFSWETNLVKPWLGSGGILIWFGWIPGYYTVEKGQSQEDIRWDSPQNLHEEGTKRLGLQDFFELIEIEDCPTTAELESPLSQILDTKYNFIQQAPLLQKVINADGLALGKIGGCPENPRSSISLIPIGKGKMIIFGYFLTASLVLNGPELSARDIAQILCSGILKANSISNILHRNYTLPKGYSKNDALNLPLDPNTAGLVIYGYSSQESSSLLFHRKFLQIENRSEQ
ncbi:MAG: hypothetical protein QXS27_09000 [Candidatus Jordarchaeaceae archaeon]